MAQQESTKPYCTTNVYMDFILKQLGELHDRKNHDYSHGNNPFSNFEETAITAGTTVDTVFRVMIGIKLARLNALTARNEAPVYESTLDSIQDLANYACIYAAWKEQERNKKSGDNHEI